MKEVKLPVCKELMLGQIKQWHWVLEQWENRISKGIPGVDHPDSGDPEVLDRFVLEMLAELSIVSQGIEAMSTALAPAVGAWGGWDRR